MDPVRTLPMDRFKLLDRLYQAGIWTCLAVALTLIFILATSYRVQAQWSTDPATPMVVCDAANSQRNMGAIADADSGYFVFWSDLRNNAQKADLYGQHFDSEGNALWAANGTLLLSNPSRSINLTAPLLMPDGSVMVLYTTGSGSVGSDTIRAMRFDADAAALWAEPPIVLGGLDYRSMKVVPSDSCAYVMAYCESCGGGGYGCRMQRVRMDGSVQFPLAGGVATGHYGPYTVHADGVGGIVHSIRCGNGAGTCLKAQRFDSLGTAVWPAYMDLADADGLNYAFSTAAEDGGGQLSVWEVNGDLRMNRIDAMGNTLWSPAVQVACDQPNGQGTPDALVQDGALYVTWCDNRAGAGGLYVQRYDLATGAEQWTADGVPAILESTYVPTSRLVPSDSGAVLAIMDMSGPHMYCAMRVRPDGTLAWDEAVSFATASGPFYEKRVELPDGNGGVVAFWESLSGDLYGARVYRNGKLYDDVGVTEAGISTRVRAYPNPANERITFDLPVNERSIGIDVMDALGRIVGNYSGATMIDIGNLPNGAYTARIRTSTSTHTARFIKF